MSMDNALKAISPLRLFLQAFYTEFTAGLPLILLAALLSTTKNKNATMECIEMHLSAFKSLPAKNSSLN